jgi:hypothetical protein
MALRSPPTITRRVHTLIAGGGVAGLAAARACASAASTTSWCWSSKTAPAATAGAGTVGGIACPQGAHYLPVPGDDRPRGAGSAGGVRPAPARGRALDQYDERHLCHSPQERLFFNGEWQDGLLPVQGVGAATLAQYQRFAARVRAAQAGHAPFAMPAFRAPASAAHLALDAHHLPGLAGPRGPERPAAALVPGLLLPRRLRRGPVQRLGLGRHPLLRQPPRLPRTPATTRSSAKAC